MASASILLGTLVNTGDVSKPIRIPPTKSSLGGFASFVLRNTAAGAASARIQVSVDGVNWQVASTIARDELTGFPIPLNGMARRLYRGTPGTLVRVEMNSGSGAGLEVRVPSLSGGLAVDNG